MRANGVSERLITGDASDWDRFAAWAATVPATLRNPVYHWTHLELRRLFGVDLLLSPGTARAVFDACNERLGGDGFSALGIQRRFSVAVVCTTDDPAESLEHHRTLAARIDPDTAVYPTWRSDRVLAVEDPETFNQWVARLEHETDRAVGGTLASMLDALWTRHGHFHDLGCRASDVGLETAGADDWDDGRANEAFERLRRRQPLDGGRAQCLKAALLYHLAVFDHTRGWVQQLHLGALRGTNSHQRARLGPDAGFDAIGDFPQARPLAQFLARLDAAGRLPKSILYNSNPSDTDLLASMTGGFHGGCIPGKIQLGAAWWFLDHAQGITAQIDALSNTSLLARFVGMTTDSRSVLSYSRHEYFRRLLCNVIGDDVCRGRLPDDRDVLGRLVQDICFHNALQYFGFTPGKLAS